MSKLFSALVVPVLKTQFDLIAVEVMPGGETEVRLIPQAMEYNW